MLPTTLIVVPQGDYDFTITEAGGKSIVDEINVRAGRIYYFTPIVQVGMTGAVFERGHFQLLRVSDVEAQAKIPRLKPIDNPYFR